MNTILFDLDGTLLPMDQDLFINLYFKKLAQYFAPKGIHLENFKKSINEGTKAMVLNDGSMTNEQRFWKVFGDIYGESAGELEPDFIQFYQNEFHQVKASTNFTPYAARCIQKLKDKNYSIVVATNPLFPPVATYARINWAGLDVNDFLHITTYDNSSYCKPNLNYYKEILNTIGKDPEECMMIGNDVTEDMCTAKLGMDTYLIKDCLINANELPLEGMKMGSLSDFELYIDTLPTVK